MKVSNIEKFRTDLYNTLSECFIDAYNNLDFVKLETSYGNYTIHNPIVVKDGLWNTKKVVYIDIAYDGSVFLWIDNKIEWCFEPSHMKNRTIYFCHIAMRLQSILG